MSAILTIVFLFLSTLTGVVDRFVKSEPWDRRLDWITAVFVVLTFAFGVDSIIGFERMTKRVMGLTEKLNEAEVRLGQAEGQAANLIANVSALGDSLDAQGLALGGITAHADSLQIELDLQRDGVSMLSSGLAASRREISELTFQGAMLSARADSLRTRSDELVAELDLRPPITEAMLVVSARGGPNGAVDLGHDELLNGAIPDRIALLDMGGQGGLFPREYAPIRRIPRDPELELCRIDQELIDWRMWWVAEMYVSHARPLSRANDRDTHPLLEPRRWLYEPCGSTRRALFDVSARDLVHRTHLWLPAPNLIDYVMDGKLSDVRLALVFRVGDAVDVLDFGDPLDVGVVATIKDEVAAVRERLSNPDTPLSSLAPWEAAALSEEERVRRIEIAERRRVEGREHTERTQVEAEVLMWIEERLNQYGVAMDLSEVYVPTNRGRWIDLLSSLTDFASPPRHPGFVDGLTYFEAPSTSSERRWESVVREYRLGVLGKYTDTPIGEITWLKTHDGGVDVWIGHSGRLYSFSAEWHRRDRGELRDHVRRLLTGATAWTYTDQEALRYFELAVSATPIGSDNSFGRLIRTSDLIGAIDNSRSQKDH